MVALTVTNVVLGLVAFWILKYFFDVIKQNFGNSPPEWISIVPVLGTLVKFGKNPVEFLLEGRRRFGDVFTATILGKRMTFLTHPTLHDIFFNRKDDELSPREVYRFVIPVFGRGIVYDAEPKVMKQQLQFVNTALIVERYRAFVPIFEQEASNYFASKFGKGGEFELFDSLAELTILTASRCLLGKEVRDNLKENRFAELYHTLEEGLNPLTFFLPWIPSPRAKGRDAARAEICRVFKEVIRKRRETEEEGHIDLLDVLMRAKYKDHTHVQLQDEEICGLLLATLFAGQHTSSITSTWTIASLLNTPEAFLEVEKEQKKVMADFGGELSYDSVNSMEFLKLCMKEALRMFPPLIMLMRYCKVDIPVGDKVVPAGSTIVVSPAASHRAGDIFENPDKYDPWRWLPPRNEEEKCTFPFIAFGRGVHRCLGETFAYLQIRTIISVLFAQYDLELVSPFPEINYDSMVAGPRKPVTVKVTKREKKRW